MSHYKTVGEKGRSALGYLPRAPTPPKAAASVPETGKSDSHDLKFDGFAIQLNGSDLEVHPDGADVALCVCVILEK